MPNFLAKFNLQKSHWQFGLSGYFKPFYAKAYVIFFLIGNFLLWLLSWLAVANIQEESAVLHYNIILGVDYIGQPKMIFLLPAYGFGIGLLNWFLSLMFFKRGSFLVHLLMLTACLAQFFLAMALYSVYLINFII